MLTVAHVDLEPVKARIELNDWTIAVRDRDSRRKCGVGDRRRGFWERDPHRDRRKSMRRSGESGDEPNLRREP
jgi:hypothetical protein